MVLDALYRELTSMGSLIGLSAIAFAFPALWVSVSWASLESGFALLFVTAIYPPWYYGVTPRTIESTMIGILFGVGAAVAICVGYLVNYFLIIRVLGAGLHAEAVAFVVISMIVLGVGYIDYNHLTS